MSQFCSLNTFQIVLTFNQKLKRTQFFSRQKYQVWNQTFLHAKFQRFHTQTYFKHASMNLILCKFDVKYPVTTATRKLVSGQLNNKSCDFLPPFFFLLLLLIMHNLFIFWNLPKIETPKLWIPLTISVNQKYPFLYKEIFNPGLNELSFSDYIREGCIILI